MISSVATPFLQVQTWVIKGSIYGVEGALTCRCFSTRASFSAGLAVSCIKDLTSPVRKIRRAETVNGIAEWSMKFAREFPQRLVFPSVNQNFSQRCRSSNTFSIFSVH
jgi:hypothetical protein